MAEVGREWVVETSGHDGLEVRRVGVYAGDMDYELSESLGWDVEPIFRRIWPGDRDCASSWQAFPLV